MTSAISSAALPNVKGHQESVTAWRISILAPADPYFVIKDFQDYYDAILTTLRPFNFNEAKFSFSEVLLATGPVLVVRFNSGAQSLKDLSKRFIAVNKSYVSTMSFDDKIFIKMYENTLESLEALHQGRVDGAVVPLVLAVHF